MVDMFTLPELATFMQQDTIDTASATLARAGAQGAVRRFCRQEFTTATWTNVPLPVSIDSRYGRGITLPQRPVTAVTSVTVNSVVVAPVAYSLDQVRNRITLLAYMPPFRHWLPDQALVSYTSGTATPPDDVKDVALAVAARIMANPTGAMRTDITLGQYRESTEYARMEATSVTLLPAEMAALGDYRRRVGSTVIR